MRYKTRVMHILQKVKKQWCSCIYADIFVCDFCLVAKKTHPQTYPTVVIVKCIDNIQNKNTNDSIVEETY